MIARSIFASLRIESGMHGLLRTLMVLQDCGISPTRNREKHEQGPPLSGCAIVAAVLDDMNNEATVEKVWEYREHVL